MTTNDSNSISEADVLRLRREVFADGIISRHEAEAVFELDQRTTDKHDDWYDFYIDELTHYFVTQAGQRGYVDGEEAAFIRSAMLTDGKLSGPTELALLVNILDRATWCPPDFAEYVLQSVRDHVLEDHAINEAEAEAVRTALHGTGSAGAYTVTRAEADLLFEISRAANEAGKSESWTDVFKRGVGTHLMWGQEAPALPSPQQIAASEERWEALKQRSFMGAIGKALLKFRPGDSVRAADPFGRRARSEAAESLAVEYAEEHRRSGIDVREAEWLAAQVAQTGFTRDVRALLAFATEHATHTAPGFDDLCHRAEAA